MISFVGNRPVLQVGRHQVAGYDTGWIKESLKRGAVAANRDDFPFVEEICHGIIHYLENRCPLRLLPIEDLYLRMEHMLNRIGCQAIAEKLPRIAPPVTICLKQTANEVGELELAFFQALHREVDELRALGVQTLNFTGVKECALALLGLPKWNSHSESLAKDIISFVRSHHEASNDGHDLRLLVESI